MLVFIDLFIYLHKMLAAGHSLEIISAKSYNSMTIKHNEIDGAMQFWPK